MWMKRLILISEGERDKEKEKNDGNGNGPQRNLIATVDLATVRYRTNTRVPVLFWQSLEREGERENANVNCLEVEWHWRLTDSGCPFIFFAFPFGLILQKSLWNVPCCVLCFSFLCPKYEIGNTANPKPASPLSVSSFSGCPAGQTACSCEVAREGIYFAQYTQPLPDGQAIRHTDEHLIGPPLMENAKRGRWEREMESLRFSLSQERHLAHSPSLSISLMGFSDGGRVSLRRTHSRYRFQLPLAP